MRIPRVELKVYRGGAWESFKFPAPKGAGFTSHGVEQTLARFMAEMEKEFPHIVFRVVRTGPGRFNILPDEFLVVPNTVAHA
jgi:hypothetical protein